MAEPIYKFFMGRFLEPWYQLSKEEQDSLQAKLRDAKKIRLYTTNFMQLKLVLGSMVVCWIRSVPGHRSGPEVHGGTSGVKLVPILREYERVGH